MPAPPVRIEIHATLEVPELDPAAARAAVARALAHGGWRGGRVDVVLLDDAGLAELHGRFLGDPSPTDVMAFELGEPGEGEAAEADGVDAGPAAEIYASVERARAVARRRGVPVARELALYLVHGALHLCGFDDHEPAERALMRAAETELLAALGYAVDEAPHEEPDGS